MKTINLFNDQLRNINRFDRFIFKFKIKQSRVLPLSDLTQVIEQNTWLQYTFDKFFVNEKKEQKAIKWSGQWSNE